jgi:putative endopeptidase
MKHLLMGVAAFALLAGCNQADVETTPKTDEIAQTPERAAESGEITVTEDGKFRTAEGLELSAADTWGDWGINLATRDMDVAPGDNFYHHVNGKWVDEFEIPADKSRFGSFDLLSEKSEQRVRNIINDLAASKPSLSTPNGKIGAFYNAYMNTDAINAAGLAPAQPYLDRIKAISNRQDLARTFATVGYTSPFNGFVFVDDKDPETYIFQMSLGGLGMPDRDYYLKTDEKSVDLRAKYLDLLTTMLAQAGDEDPAKSARDVLALETQIARTDWDRTLSRNPEITYNKLTKAELTAMAGEFPLDTMLQTIGIQNQQNFLVTEVTPTAAELAAAGISTEDAKKLGSGYVGAFRLANTAPLDTWKAYLTAHFLIDNASVMPTAIDEATFAFYGTALRGQPEQRERWKRAVSATQGVLGEAIGKEFVARHFPAENKAAMDDLVANLRTAMKSNLDDLTWMGAATKVKAEEKLNSFNPKIGYPVEFETYDTLKVGNNALENAIAASDWGFKDNLSKLGSTVDKNEWFMTPQRVNAYYNPSFNEIVFPAAILQPPFFNITADPAVNYGAIGGVIGHEMGHGFDDQGAKFDSLGVLNNWWTTDDQAAFRKLGDALAAQYDTFCPLDEGETCVNGRLALGENIGDLGGLSMAYRAYKLSLNGKEDKVIDGLTGDQRFFMAWAQVWRSKYREEALRQQLQTGPHSPPLYRVNGVVRNFDEWYEAFGVTPDHALYLPPEERIRIW